jgi:prolyl-tRNA synthetase
VLAGGNRSHEVHVLSDVGEDLLLSCAHCNYTANVEKAVSSIAIDNASHTAHQCRTFWTRLFEPPHHVPSNIQDFASVSMHEMADRPGTQCIVVVPADSKPNQLKMHKYLCDNHLVPDVETTTEAATTTATSAQPPIVLVDSSMQPLIDSDFVSRVRIGDFREAKHGDTCAACTSGVLAQSRGIEVGHLFYLGTKYSQALDLNIVESTGNRHMEMGCFGYEGPTNQPTNQPHIPKF